MPEEVNYTLTKKNSTKIMSTKNDVAAGEVRPNNRGVTSASTSASNRVSSRRGVLNM